MLQGLVDFMADPFQALDNSYQNRLRNFPNEAVSELNVATRQFEAANTTLVEEIGIVTFRADCAEAEVWYAGITDDVTEYLTTIDGIGVDTAPSPEIRQAIFDLNELRTRIDVAFPTCATEANNRLENSVVAAVSLFQAIMAEESASAKQQQLAVMVSEATEFINEMRRLGIRIE